MGKNEKGRDRREKLKEEDETHQNQQHQKVNSRKKKRQEVAPYGNYRNYYGYRIDRGADEDPRLRVLKKEWFENKDCLDIGCNSGVLTIQIAKKFHCRSIVGIDIDSNRIEDAYWQLRRVVGMKCSSKMHAKTSTLESANNADGSEHSATTLDEETTGISRNNSRSEESNLSDIVSFRQENFVQSRHSPPETFYDTIICLSVTKWVHMNWGDDGLIDLFVKIWKLLRPGGILVLEPQPWSSYISNHLVSETTAFNYHNIMLFPKQFQEILLEKIGFRMVEDITSGIAGKKTGFNRPILAFHK